MPHDPEIPGSATDWLVRARSDMAVARVPLPESAMYESLCFHAQQAAEKARSKGSGLFDVVFPERTLRITRRGTNVAERSEPTGLIRLALIRWFCDVRVRGGEFAGGCFVIKSAVDRVDVRNS